MRNSEFGHILSLATALLMGGFFLTRLAAAENQAPAPPASANSLAEKPSAVHALLVQAIKERRIVKFTYRGHLRVVEPHAFGRNSKGDAVLHAFQIKGSSASRPPPGWRTFSARAIEDPKLGKGSFAQARDGYSPNELHLAPLWAEVPALVVEE
jgi:hypothetical protein